MAQGRDVEYQWAFSALEQADYDTVVADNDLDFCYPVHGPDLGQEVIDFKPDDDEFGKGIEFLTAQDEESHDLTLARNMDLTSFIAGFIGAFGLGQVSSAANGSTPESYTHTCKFSDPATTGLQDPVFCVVEKDGAGLKQKFKSLAVDSFTISGAMKERIKLEMSLVGDGSRAASTITMPRQTRGSFLRFSGGQLEFGVAGALVDLSEKCRSFKLTVSKNLDKDGGYTMGGGLNRNHCLHGTRQVDLEFQMLMADETEWAYWRANTLLQAVLTFTGAVIDDSPAFNHALTITLKTVKIFEPTKSFEAGKQVMNVKCRCLWDEINDIGDVTYTPAGSPGLSDLTVAGTPTAGDAEYDVQLKITTAGATDKFDWSLDAGVTWEATAVTMTGSPQTLGTTGITVDFAATTGHTADDTWDFSTTSRQGPILWEAVNTQEYYLEAPP